jgi:hypothetical protein
MGELEWHMSKSSFCNDISPNGENCSGIDLINPILFGNAYIYIYIYIHTHAYVYFYLYFQIWISGNEMAIGIM